MLARGEANQVEGTRGQGDMGARAMHARGQVSTLARWRGEDTMIHGRHAVPPLPKAKDIWTRRSRAPTQGERQNT